MKRSIVLAGAHSLATLVELSKDAEAAGFHRIWTTESHSRDALLRAAVIAVNTRTIRIGTGIAYAFTRAPLGMAAAAAEIRVLSDGRFTLGLGAMTRGMRRGWYGLEIDHPAPRLKEYVRFVRAALGARVGFSFSGRFYRADVPRFELVGDHALLASTPIYGSGVNVLMLKACADVCDGIALHSIASALPYYDSVVAPAIARSGRDVSLAVWRITAVNSDGDVARSAARRNIAFYLTTPSYRTVAQGRPWADRITVIQEAFRASGPAPDWRRLEAFVSDDMLDELALAGTPAEVGRRIGVLESEYACRGVDEIVFQTVETGMEEQALRRDLALVIDALRPSSPASA